MTRLRYGGIAAALAVCFTMLAAAPAEAAPAGTLDPGFGSGPGFVTTSAGSSGFAYLTDAASQPSDGKIVVVGAVGNAVSGQDVLVARYNTDGSLDASFGSGGIVITPLDSSPGANNIGEAVAIQSDGKIVVAARGGGDTSAVIRYNANGTLDQAFDGDSGLGNGIVITNLTANDEQIDGIDVDANHIVVSGYANVDPSAGGGSGDYRAALARYDKSDGKLDTSFDGPSGTG